MTQRSRDIARAIKGLLLGAILAWSSVSFAEGVTWSQEMTTVGGLKFTPYSGVTSGSGTYTVSFPAAYATIPAVIIQPAGSSTTRLTVTSVTTTGFTVTAASEPAVTILGLSVPSAVLTPLNGQSVRVIVIGS